MTRLVVLAPASATTIYDEVAVFASALSGTAIADLYASGPVDFTADPQETIGWEEVYGADYPLVAGDVPVIQNGLCRVRWNSTFLAFVVDAFVEDIGWQEVARVTVFHDAAVGTYVQQGQLQSAEIVEYTWERVVIGVVTSVTISGQVYRMETFITLQRGWTGPRFECYPNPIGGAKLGARIVVTPATANFGSFISGVGSEPWLAAVGGIKTLALTWLRAETWAVITDATAYGASRSALAVSAIQGGALAGYVSVRLGLCARGIFMEAEDSIGSSGGVSVVSDGAANSGLALQETRTDAASQTFSMTPAQIARIGLGKYQLWARVRQGTGGNTSSVQGWFGALSNPGTGPIATFTSGTYLWLYVGEITHTVPADYLNIVLWRSAGGGASQQFLDYVGLVPVERRQAGDPAYDGARDLMAENLLDARAIPELVAR